MKLNWAKIIIFFELIIAAIVIIFDLFIPTLLILAFLVISIVFKKFKFSSLGFKKISSPLKTIFLILLSVVLLQLFDVGVIMPIINHTTGQSIDYSSFGSIHGDLSRFLVLLLLAWFLAALGEEIVYRGYIFQLAKNLLTYYPAIIISSLLFGLAHTEQGFVGVIVTTFDAVVFSLLNRKFNQNLWISVIAHGFYNTIGLVFAYFFGPIHQLW